MVNTNEILGTENGYPMYDLIRAHIGVEEELSLFIFTVGIMIGKVSYLLIFFLVIITTDMINMINNTF